MESFDWLVPLHKHIRLSANNILGRAENSESGHDGNEEFRREHVGVDNECVWTERLTGKKDRNKGRSFTGDILKFAGAGKALHLSGA